MASPSCRTSQDAQRELGVRTGLDLGELCQRIEKLEKGGSTETEDFMGFNTLARTRGSGTHTRLLEAYREQWPTFGDMKVPQLPQQTL